jgi:hypothetical protein
LAIAVTPLSVEMRVGRRVESYLAAGIFQTSGPKSLEYQHCEKIWLTREAVNLELIEMSGQGDGAELQNRVGDDCKFL